MNGTWISVTNILPPIMAGFKVVTDTVEVKFDDGTLGRAFYCHREGHKGWYSEETGDLVEKNVTHWRPNGR